MGIGLAPMEGVTCLATRLWFSLTSQPDFVLTPFLRVTNGYPAKRIPSVYATELFHCKSAVSYQLIPQLMGSCPSDIARIAEHLLTFTPFIDVNCGCPSPTVVGHRAGSGLLETPDVFYQFTKELKELIGHKQFSLKMRSGFSHDDEFSDLLNVAMAIKPAQLTLHARTRADGYKGKARWQLIHTAAKGCDFPVVGSGDINDFQTFQERIAIAPSIQKVIIGRGALRNPWVFNEIRHSKSTDVSFNVLSYALAVFALLHDMEHAMDDQLIELMQQQFFSSCCDTSESKWENIYRSLSIIVHKKYVDVKFLEIEKVSFAKMKMLWNYMRSSFPKEFMAPLLFRAKDFSEFIHVLSSLPNWSNSTHISLKNQPEWDWIYSGEKK